MNLPIRLLLAVSFFLAPAGMGIGASFAQDPIAMAQAVPVEISEVVSGGIWSDGGMEGVYRAVVILTPEGDRMNANVVVQQIALQEPGQSPKLVKSIAIKEVLEKKLSNAFLSMNAESEEGMMLIITSYDPEKEEQSALFVQFDDAGNYSLKPVSGNVEGRPAHAFPDPDSGKDE